MSPAPHTLEEKARIYPAIPSGMHGVQTIVPLMLDKVITGQIDLKYFMDLLCFNPKNTTFKDEQMATKCKWTPYHGHTLSKAVLWLNYKFSKQSCPVAKL